MTDWTELVNHALLGTERRVYALPGKDAQGDALTDILKNVTAETPERALDLYKTLKAKLDKKKR